MARRTRNQLMIGGLLLLGVLVLAFPFLWMGYLRWRNEGEYERRRDRYEALLARLKQEKLPENGMAWFFVDAERNHESLRRLADDAHDERFLHHKEGRIVEVHRMEDGSRLINYVNRDLGAFGGVLSLIHSAAPPQAGLFGLTGIFKNVGPGWWAAHYGD